MPAIFWVVPAAGIITVIFAIFLARNVLKRSMGTPKMKEIGDIIFQAAWASGSWWRCWVEPRWRV